jgi:hypothetical protein
MAEPDTMTQQSTRNLVRFERPNMFISLGQPYVRHTINNRLYLKRSSSDDPPYLTGLLRFPDYMLKRSGRSVYFSLFFLNSICTVHSLEWSVIMIWYIMISCSMLCCYGARPLTSLHTQLLKPEYNKEWSPNFPRSAWKDGGTF